MILGPLYLTRFDNMYRQQVDAIKNSGGFDESAGWLYDRCTLEEGFDYTDSAKAYWL